MDFDKINYFSKKIIPVHARISQQKFTIDYDSKEHCEQVWGPWHVIRSAQGEEISSWIRSNQQSEKVVPGKATHFFEVCFEKTWYFNKKGEKYPYIDFVEEGI